MSGQQGIRLREALRRGDATGAAAELPDLDEPHVVELLLGAALRDAREDFAAARSFVRAWSLGPPGRAGAPLPAAWQEVLDRLARPAPDDRLDRAAASWVASGRVPERWRAWGPPPSEDPRRAASPELAAARALAEGAGGRALLACFADLPLHAPVALYYEAGTIHALGTRPLLILAMTAGYSTP